LYEACKPEILGKRKEFPLVAIIHYLRDVMDGRVDRGNLDNAKRRISRLLDESIVAQEEAKNQGVESPDFANATEKKEYFIKAWKQIDLSKLDVEKLKEEYKTAPYKNIEIADLRAFIAGKLQQMMERNVTRNSFAQKLQEIIDRYNSGGALTEDYFEALVNFVDALREEELRATKEGLSEEELELFDLLKKESLTKEEEQKVKLAAKNLLKRLKEEKPTVLVHDWHKDTQTRNQVKNVIEQILDIYLPDPTYNRTLFASKSNKIYEHFFLQAVSGANKAVA
jgi:type I restriction enzyme, R subunit